MNHWTWKVQVSRRSSKTIFSRNRNRNLKWEKLFFPRHI